MEGEFDCVFGEEWAISGAAFKDGCIFGEADLLQIDSQTKEVVSKFPETWHHGLSKTARFAICLIPYINVSFYLVRPLGSKKFELEMDERIATTEPYRVVKNI